MVLGRRSVWHLGTGDTVMITIWWANANPTGAINSQAAEGDIFVATSTWQQRRRNGSGGWDVIVPPDTRADVAPWGFAHHTTLNSPGAFNDRLAVVGSARPWELAWRNAASGVVGPPVDKSPSGVEGQHVQVTAEEVWDVEHSLGAELVDVTVISSDGATILIPEIAYVTGMLCRLTFRDKVAGTAIVRR